MSTKTAKTESPIVYKTIHGTKYSRTRDYAFWTPDDPQNAQDDYVCKCGAMVFHVWHADGCTFARCASCGSAELIHGSPRE